MKIELVEQKFLTERGLERRATFIIYGDETYEARSKTGVPIDNPELIGEPIPIHELSDSFFDEDSYNAYVEKTTAMCQEMVAHYQETLEPTISEIPLVPEEPEEPEIAEPETAKPEIAEPETTETPSVSAKKVELTQKVESTSKKVFSDKKKKK